MKQCPICHCITEEENECHVCGTTITYELSAYAENRERLAWNRYTRRYLIRKLWFPVLCTGIVAGLILLNLPLEPLTKTYTMTIGGREIQTTGHNSNEPYMCLSLLAGILSLLTAVFERPWIRWMEWKYQKEYAVWRVTSSQYILGGLAVATAFMFLFS